MESLLTYFDCIEALTDHRPGGNSFILSEGAVDSRQVIPAAMFIAIPGERQDGHDFVSDAFKRGASLALVQKDLSAQFPQVDIRKGWNPALQSFPESPFCLLVNDSLKSLQQISRFWRRKLDVRVIGITGSVGKSTTKELVAEVLSMRFTTLKNPGNLNNEIGLPLTLLKLSAGYERAVLEMGFYKPGEITFLCDLAFPQVGVITNIGTVHAERAGSQETIAKGKAELLHALPAAPEGKAILNYDDPWVRPMAKETKAQILMYGLDPAADLWADEIESQGLRGIQMRLHYHGEIMHIRVPLIGEHSVHTVLRAASVGLVEGLSWGEIITGLQESHSQLRLVAVHSKNGALILDDTYNASPESTLAALTLLNEIDGHKVAVLGDMLELGQYEQQGHEKVGFRTAEVVEKLIAIGERGKLIVEAAKKAGMSSKQIRWFPDALSSIEMLSATLKEGDVVLIKGSHGLRMDRIVAALEVDS